MLFDNNDMNMDFSFLDLVGLNNNNDNYNNSMDKYNGIYSANEGFLRGNMWVDEYIPYKNMSFVKISPKNDREAKMFTVMQYAFAINDLNLYLDIHPEDNRVYKIMKQLIKEKENVKDEYVKLYGPLTIMDEDGNNFEWINGPWPWENMGGNKYV